MKNLYIICLLLMFSKAHAGYTFTVSSTADTGSGTLRAAIDSANNSGSPDDTIVLMLTSADTIKLATELDQINVTLTVKGNSCSNPTIAGNNLNGFYYPAFYCPGTTLTLQNLNFINFIDKGWGEGGAAYAANMIVMDCYFANNSLYITSLGGACNGGAICSNTNIRVYNSTFYQNSVASTTIPSEGGAVAFFSSNGFFVNCTFVANTAGNNGSAIWGNPWTVYNCTFANNSASGGGVIYSQVFSTVANNIFWGNTGGSYPGLYYTNSCTSGGCNILQEPGDDTLFTPSSGDTFGVNPNLGTLGYYGGCVPTMPFICGSIAEHRGSCVNSDSSIYTGANGVVAQGTPDDGAFETTPMSISTRATASGGHNGTASVSDTGGIMPYTYSWSNGRSTDTITGLAPDNYIVTVTDLTGCSLTASADVISTGISGIEGFSRFNLFPNPVSTTVEVQVQTAQESLQRLDIIDIEGHTIFSTHCNQSGQWKAIIDISSFASGIYFVQITGNQSVARRPLVVQH